MFYEFCMQSNAFSHGKLKMMDSCSKNGCERVCGGTNHRQGLFLLNSSAPLICTSHCPVTFGSLLLLNIFSLPQRKNNHPHMMGSALKCLALKLT